MLARTLLALPLVVASSLTAQTSAVGRWRLEYPVSARVDANGVIPVRGTGTLQLRVDGDSLIGTLVADPSPERQGTPSQPATLSGRVAGDSVFLISRTGGTLTANGQIRELVAITSWRLKLSGDDVTGTVERQIQGLPMANQGPQVVTGSRAR